jgi:hypothetical protein
MGVFMFGKIFKRKKIILIALLAIVSFLAFVLYKDLIKNKKLTNNTELVEVVSDLDLNDNQDLVKKTLNKKDTFTDSEDQNILAKDKSDNYSDNTHYGSYNDSQNYSLNRNQNNNDYNRLDQDEVLNIEPFIDVLDDANDIEADKTALKNDFKDDDGQGSVQSYDNSSNDNVKDYSEQRTKAAKQIRDEVGRRYLELEEDRAQKRMIEKLNEKTKEAFSTIF